MHRHPTLIARVRAWPRIKKIGASVGVLVVVGAAVAVALVTLRAPIQGALEVPAVDPTAAEFFGTPTVSQNGAECTATVTDGTLILDVTGAPGAGCNVLASVRTVGESNRTFVVQGVSYHSDFTTEFFVSGGGSAPVPCGLPIDTTGRDVVFTVAVDEGAPVGTHPAASTAGVTVVDEASYVDDECPRALLSL